MRVRCTSCGGVYVRRLPDGLEYYHTCPSPVIVTVTRGADTLDVPLSSMRKGDVEVSRRDGENPNARDENVVVEQQQDGTRVTRIKAEGLGTEPAL